MCAELTYAFHAGVTDCLLAALMAAVAFVAIRFIPKSESSLSIALSFHTMGVITSVLPLAVSISTNFSRPSPVYYHVLQSNLAVVRYHN